MSKGCVLDTRVASRRERRGPDGRLYAVVEISYPCFEYQPGQFVMIRSGARAYQWSYPHLVYRRTDSGFLVIAPEASPLFGEPGGAPLVVWGANGRGVGLSGSLHLVAEAATYFLLAPLAQAYGLCTATFIGGMAAGPIDTELVEVRLAADVDEAVGQTADPHGQTVVALNPHNLLLFLERQSDQGRRKTLVYAGSQMVCGIGACRGCYLHDPEIRAGVPVCCDGPFLPCERVDWALDQKCLQILK